MDYTSELQETAGHTHAGNLQEQIAMIAMFSCVQWLGKAEKTNKQTNKQTNKHIVAVLLFQKDWYPIGVFLPWAVE